MSAKADALRGSHETIHVHWPRLKNEMRRALLSAYIEIPGRSIYLII